MTFIQEQIGMLDAAAENLRSLDQTESRVAARQRLACELERMADSLEVEAQESSSSSWPWVCLYLLGSVLQGAACGGVVFVLLIAIMWIKS